MFQNCFVKHSLKYFSAQELLKPIFVDFKLNAMKNSLFQVSVSDLHSVKPGLKEVYLKRSLFCQANFICYPQNIERYGKTWYLFGMVIRLGKIQQATSEFSPFKYLVLKLRSEDETKCKFALIGRFPSMCMSFGQKIHSRANFSKILTNFTSEESSINAVYDKKKYRCGQA